MAGEKTEKATPKRKSDERKKGNVFQSKEVVSVGTLLIIFYAFKSLAPLILGTLEKNIQVCFEWALSMDVISVSNVQEIFLKVLLSFVVATMPLLLIGCVSSVILTGAQTKFLVSFSSIKPKGSRMNPLQGIKKMFSMRGVVELIKSLMKITVLGVILYNEMKKKIPLLPRMMDMSIMQAMAITGEMILSIVKTAAIFFAFVAAADYLYQWWEYEKNLRMSKQEIKEEYKQTEGDPQVKGKIREKQQQQSRKRMMQNVPQADVVIRNPTHFAVALKYDSAKQIAPIVVAKGADHLALKIVEIAEKNNVTVLENKPLARGLYETVDLDEQIPEKYYQPVAEVLAFVYNLKKKTLI